MLILGVYCGHDANACILRDGQIIVHIEKERLTRRKGDVGNADACIQYCLDATGLSLDDIDYVATCQAGDPTYKHSVETLTGEIYSRPTQLYSEHEGMVMGKRKTAFFIQHHLAHAASSFYNSPFDRAAILSVDGWGDFTATLLATGDADGIHVLEMPLCNIGTVWVAFCTTLGFGTRHSEGTVMALASFGEPIYYDPIREWCGGDWRAFRIQGRNRTYQQALEMIWHGEHSKIWRSQDGGVKFVDTPEVWYGVPLFEGLQKTDPLREKNRNIAASLQQVTQDVLAEAANSLYEQTGLPDLCLVGGVALNCVANSDLLKRTPFQRIFVPPSTHDGGLAMGSAFYLYHAILGHSNRYPMMHPYLGRTYSEAMVLDSLQQFRLPFRRYPQYDQVIEEKAADLVSRGRILAWFQGGSEIGPRALGHRSIVCDPRSPHMKDILNARVKHRASFRPFAPSVLEAHVSEVFDWTGNSPFMLFTASANPDFTSRIPAVMHVDGTARLQTVNSMDNDSYFKMIQAFYQRTGIPLVLNTSFNDAGEPIVESPSDAIRCFMHTDIDCLILGDYLVCKKEEDFND